MYDIIRASTTTKGFYRPTKKKKGQRKMNNYEEILGETELTDCGEYTIVAHTHEDGCRDDSLNLYVGRAADGHHDLIASDNASMWVVGDEDDAERNRAHWELINERVGEIDFDAIRAIDADLAEWLEDRKAEADEAKSATT
jgi:hypothetical protein